MNGRINVWLYMYGCMYVCMHVCIYICVCVCVCMNVCMCLCWCCICFNDWHYFQSLSSSSSLSPLLFIWIDLRGYSFWSDETFQRVTIHLVSYGA
jgi:hypothetical protein